MTAFASLPLPAQAPATPHADADEAPPSVDLVTVSHRFNSLEAEMLRGCLEAQGIPATLGDAQTIQTDTLLTAAMGGIRVMVPAPFAEAAIATVAAFERGELAIDELPADAPPAASEQEGKSDFSFRWVNAAWVVALVVVIALVFF